MSLKTCVASALLVLTMPLAHAAEPADSEPAKPAAATVPAAARINVNTADVLTLTGLKGVGEKRPRPLSLTARQRVLSIPWSSSRQCRVLALPS